MVRRGTGAEDREWRWGGSTKPAGWALSPRGVGSRGKARAKGGVCADVLLLTSVLFPSFSVHHSLEGAVEGGVQHRTGGALLWLEFPFFLAYAVNICNVTKYEEGPRGGVRTEQEPRLSRGRTSRGLRKERNLQWRSKRRVLSLQPASGSQENVWSG